MWSGSSQADSFLVDSSMISLPSTFIDGGAGSDTVAFSGTTSITSMTTLDSILSNVETIDFTNANVNANLTVGASDVTTVSGATSLTMNINAGDSVAASGEFDTTVNGASTTYDFFSDAGHTIHVATLIVNAS